jgi:hypothetical protein
VTSFGSLGVIQLEDEEKINMGSFFDLPTSIHSVSKHWVCKKKKKRIVYAGETHPPTNSTEECPFSYVLGGIRRFGKYLVSLC